jgi:shikimate kinase
MKTNIYIGGFSGIGKTTVSKLLAKELNKSLVSIDEIVQKYMKTSIEEYVKKHGFSATRKVFEGILGILTCSLNNTIVDLSGGISDSKNLTNQNTIILLSSKELILERYKNKDNNDKNRFAKRMDKELFDKFYEQKINGYKKIGKKFINVSINDSPEDIKNKILNILN